MPEGDTIYKTAARLRPALAGHVLVRFEAPRLRGDAPKLGTRIERVEARGKHLLIEFTGGPTLRTHLRMTTLGEALLDQRIAAGIGNVYKSEACFAAGVDPATPIELVDEQTRRRVWSIAGRQLQANLGQAERRTPPGRARRLRPPGPALPPVRHAGRHGSPRRPGEEHVLVPHVPTRRPNFVNVFTSSGILETWPWSPRSWWSAPGSAGSRWRGT